MPVNQVENLGLFWPWNGGGGLKSGQKKKQQQKKTKKKRVLREITPFLRTFLCSRPERNMALHATYRNSGGTRGERLHAMKWIPGGRLK